MKGALLLLCFSSAWLAAEGSSKTESLQTVLYHFNSTRNNNVDPAAKQKARDFIVKTFQDHELDTWLEEFPSNNEQYKGINVIGRLPGKYSGSRDDNILLIGAHYDSLDTTPGVDDNGSGTAALLQALKLFLSPDKLNCSRDYSLWFVAFDLEEYQQVCARPGTCSCSDTRCGSEHFVNNFTAFLNTTGASFQGALVLETILNYNDTPHSQKLPENSEILVPDVYHKVQANQFRGNFLSVIGRSPDDDLLIGNITNAFDTNDNMSIIDIKLPYPGKPSGWPVQLHLQLDDFFRSDHYRFWNANPSLPALFITDTADFRGHMKVCYHESCDNIDHVTPKMLQFLARTIDSLAGVASNMTNEVCEMKSKDCGETVTSDKGSFTTPYYDTKYPNNLHCVWIITVDAGQTDLGLKFAEFDLEESVNCTADYIEIRDGNTEMAPVIGARHCGMSLPDPVKATGRSLLVSFHSDELDAFKGFKAEWSSTPVTKSPATGQHQTVWQLIGFLFVTSLLCAF